MDLKPHIDKFARRFVEVEAALSDPKAFDNPQRAQELSREYARLKDLVASGQAYLKVTREVAENRSLLQTEPGDSELGQLAKEEMPRLEAEQARLSQEVQRGILPPDPADSRTHLVSHRRQPGASRPLAVRRRRAVLAQPLPPRRGLTHFSPWLLTGHHNAVTLRSIT